MNKELLEGFSVLKNLVHVSDRPIYKGFDMWHQSCAQFREAVFHTGRHFGVYFAVHQAVGLQSPERDGQHPL